MLTPNNFKDYELLDASNGEKLERWGKYILLRPDPTVIWDNGNLLEKYKEKIDAIYYRSNKGGGHWENLRKIPSTWTINYKDLTFNIKQMGFKHTGIFPEQAVNWEYMMNKIENAKRNIRTDYIGHIADTLEINVKELFVEKNEVINTRRPRKSKKIIH